MKKLPLILLFFPLFSFGQYKTGKELLKAMHTKFAGKYCQTIQFDQKTIRYTDAGAVKDTGYWYEWISYPDKFRIDFDKKFGGNCVIFKNDSVFNYKNHKIARKGRDENDLLLILGGMYYRPFEEVVARLERLDYDLAKISETTVDKNIFYIIGASTGNTENKAQMWVDKKDLKVVKLVTKLNENDWLEIRFEDFKKSCNGFTETKVTALKNGKLEQKEQYLNLKTGIAIPDSIFNK